MHGNANQQATAGFVDVTMVMRDLVRGGGEPGHRPGAFVKTICLVMPLMRQIDEMLHQQDELFVVDDQRFRERQLAV